MPFPQSGIVRPFAATLAVIVVLLSPRNGETQAAPAPDADSISLTLGTVYDAVDRANPRARAAAQLARATAARVPGARVPPDPRLQVGFMNYGLPSLSPDGPLAMRQLQLMQMVPLPGKLSAATAAARARADAAESQAADVRWGVRAEAAMAFYDAWAAGERIAVARETRRLMEDVASIAAAMYRVGEGRQADVLRARVEIARMDEEIVRMRAMREGALARLAEGADLPGEMLAARPVLPAFPDSVHPREALEQAALATRPMLDAGVARVSAASADARLARRELWPDLEVGVQYGEQSMGGGTDRMGSLMLGATLPVFARSRQLRMREEAAAMREMAEAELAAMRASTRARVIEVHAALMRARRLAVLYRDTVLPQADAAAESALSSYRSGTVDFMTVLDNRATVNRYREESIALSAEEGRAWAELEMLLGRRLLDDAAMVPAGGLR